MTPEQLATLARAMGYEVEIDATGGYGVERVVLIERVSAHYEVGGGDPPCMTTRRTVFRPHEDAAQALDVMAWLDSNHGIQIVRGEFRVYHGDTGRGYFENHNGTMDSIRRAIVEAAVRVAEAAD